MLQFFRKAIPACLLLFITGQVTANTFTVTSNADAGAGTLRQAITDANTNPGADIIEFNIGGGGAQSITVSTALPTITEALTIDGTTQPGYGGTPLIAVGSAFGSTVFYSTASGVMVFSALDASAASASGGICFQVTSATSVIINNCRARNRNFGLYINSCGDVTITNTDLTNSGVSSGYAIYFDNNNGALIVTDNTFGGTTTAGIRIGGSTGKTIGASTGDIQVGNQLKEMNIPVEVIGGSNITLTGLDLGRSTTGGYININNVTGVNLTGCILTNRQYGFIMSSCSNVAITGCDFTNSGVSGGYAMYFESISGTLSATGNIFGGATTSGIRMGTLSGKTIGATTGDIQVGNQLKEINIPIEVLGGSNITLTGLDLGKTAVGGYVNINNVTGFTMTNCILTNRTFGVIVSSSSNVTITGCNFTDSGVSGGYAMYFESNGGSLTATGNTFGGATTAGIRMGNLSGKTIGASIGDIQVGNQLKEMNTPLIIAGGSNITVTGLDLGKSGAVGSHLDISSVTGITITDNIVTNRVHGLVIQSCSSIIVTGNDLTNSGVSGGYALYLANDNLSGGNISGNNIGGATTGGLYLNSVSNATIAPASGQIQVGTQLKAINTPLIVTGGSNITVTGLDLEKTGATGSHIDFSNVTNLTVTNNIFKNRIHGLVIQNCSSVTATGNDLTNCGVSGGYAIYLNGISGALDVSNNILGGTTTNGLFMNNMSNRIVSDGSVGGSNVVIPDGSIFKTLSGISVNIKGGSGNSVQGLDLENTGGSRVGTAISVENSSNFTASNNQIIKRGNGININGGSSTFTCNNIKDNNNGVALGGSGSSAINDNAIWLNTIGINNGGQTVNATNNWWGSAAGPGAGGNNGTNGSGITTTPFSTTVPGCVEGSGFPKTYIFYGTVNNDWATDANWSSGSRPISLNSDDAVIIDANCFMNDVVISFPTNTSLTVNAGKALNASLNSYITISSGVTLTVQAGASLTQGRITNTGTMNISGSYSAFFMTNNSGGVMNILSGGSYACPSCAETFLAGGIVNNSGTLHVGTPSTWQGTINNNSSGVITDGGNGTQLSFGNSSTVNNYGSFVSRTASTSGVFNNYASGSLTMPGTCSFTIKSGGSFVNAGTLTAGNSDNVLNINSGGNLTNTGTVTINGTMVVSAGGNFFNNGTYKGFGNYTSTLFTNPSAGIVAPGNSPGCSSFANGFTNNGTVNIELGGTSSCTSFDQINVTGTATISSGSTLNVTLVNGYVGTNGDQASILIASNRNGGFTNVNLPPNWFINYTATAIILSYGASLPVEMVSFTGKLKGDAVQLNWLTASELNNSGFQIERSNDGIRWNEIGWVAGNGTTHEIHDYDFLDEKPFHGTNYYRLRQMDFDGKEELSNIVSVDLKGADDFGNMNVYPNPVSNGELYITVPDEIDSDFMVHIYNCNGQRLQSFQLLQGNNVINVHDLPSGVYILQGNGFNKRVVVE